jgi:endonuclease-3
MRRAEKYTRLIAHFSEVQPDPHTELHYGSPFQLLIATILSAQCTDKRVNLTTPVLFETFSTAYAMAKAIPEEIFPFIQSISYPHAKAKYLASTAKRIVEVFDGKVPRERDALESLAGVGRKTANVILATIYAQPAIAVDTHVQRVATRIGLVSPTSKSPLQIERELTAYIPSAHQQYMNHWLVLHGRYICTARKPACHRCPFTALCEYYQTSH